MNLAFSTRKPVSQIIAISHHRPNPILQVLLRRHIQPYHPDNQCHKPSSLSFIAKVRIFVIRSSHTIIFLLIIIFLHIIIFFLIVLIFTCCIILPATTRTQVGSLQVGLSAGTAHGRASGLTLALDTLKQGLRSRRACHPNNL